jgi:flavin reductase (DIM6/NTAB) family NADH-FMN oxidoreductase RutF
MTFYRMFYPRQTCYLATSYENKANVTVVDWVMPVSVKPPMIAVALNNSSHSLDLLSHSKEFTISIMPERCAEQAAQLGAATGRLIDKIDEYAIAMRRAKSMDAPLMKDAIGAVECRVVQITDGGDHSVVVGEVVEMHFPDEEGEKAPVLFNFGNKAYFGISRGMEKRLNDLADEKKAEEKRENGEKAAQKEKSEEKKEQKALEIVRKEAPEKAKEERKEAEKPKEEKKEAPDKAKEAEKPKDDKPADKKEGKKESDKPKEKDIPEKAKEEKGEAKAEEKK